MVRTTYRGHNVIASWISCTNVGKKNTNVTRDAHTGTITTFTTDLSRLIKTRHFYSVLRFVFFPSLSCYLIGQMIFWGEKKKKKRATLGTLFSSFGSAPLWLKKTPTAAAFLKCFSLIVSFSTKCFNSHLSIMFHLKCNSYLNGQRVEVVQHHMIGLRE